MRIALNIWELNHIYISLTTFVYIVKLVMCWLNRATTILCIVIRIFYVCHINIWLVRNLIIKCILAIGCELTSANAMSIEYNFNVTMNSR